MLKASFKINLATDITYEQEVSLSWSSFFKAALRRLKLGWLIDKTSE